MILKTIETQNYCQFPHSKFEFTTGINGIVAPIGSGKSNLLRAIEGSLTNEFAPDGQKADDRTYGSDRKQHAWVRATWEHDKSLLEITRGVDPSKSRLRYIDGAAEDLTSSKLIAEAIRNLTDVSPEVLARFAFVKQWECSTFLSESDQARMMSFMSLCGLEGIEKLRAQMANQLSLDRAAVVQVEDSRAELQQEIAQLEQEVEEHTTSIKKLESRILPDEERLKIERKVQLANKVLEAGRRLKQLATERTELQKKIDHLQGLIKQLTEQKEKLEIEYQEAKTNFDNLKVQEEKAIRYQKYLDTSLRLKRDISAELPAAPEIPAGWKPGEVSQLKMSIQGGKIYLDELEKKLQVFMEQGLTECPTCGTLAKTIQENLVPIWQDEIAGLQKSIPMSESQLKLFNSYEEKLKAHEKEVAQITYQIERSKKELESLTVEPAAKLSEPGYLKKYETKVDQLEDTLADVESRLQSAVVDHARLEGQRKSNIKDYTQNEALASKKVPADYLEKAKLKLDTSQDCRTQRAGLVAKRESAETLIKSKQERIQSIGERIEKSQVMLNWVSSLERARDELHRSRLPTDLMYDMLAPVVEEANRMLEPFGSPFEVICERDLKFTMQKPGRMAGPISRLSGGERLLFSAMFRFAAAKKLVSSIDLICMDEPFHGLNVDIVNDLTLVLQDISRNLKAEGKQMIIITHDETIRRAFDTELQL